MLGGKEKKERKIKKSRLYCHKQTLDNNKYSYASKLRNKKEKKKKTEKEETRVAKKSCPRNNNRAISSSLTPHPPT
jgi:hypothetical protein